MDMVNIITIHSNHLYWTRSHFLLFSTGQAHHEVSRQEFLEKLCLLVLNSLNDEFIITRNIEDGSTGSRIRQLDQWLVTQRILWGKDRSVWVKQSKHIDLFRTVIYLNKWLLTGVLKTTGVLQERWEQSIKYIER